MKETQFKIGDKVVLKKDVSIESMKTLCGSMDINFPPEMQKDFFKAKRLNNYFEVVNYDNNAMLLRYNNDAWSWPIKVFELYKENITTDECKKEEHFDEWCVKITEENRQELENWRRTRPDSTHTHTCLDPGALNKWLLSYRYDGSYLYYGHTNVCQEITIERFRKITKTEKESKEEVEKEPQNDEQKIYHLNLGDFVKLNNGIIFIINKVFPNHVYAYEGISHDKIGRSWTIEGYYYLGNSIGQDKNIKEIISLKDVDKDVARNLILSTENPAIKWRYQDFLSKFETVNEEINTDIEDEEIENTSIENNDKKTMPKEFTLNDLIERFSAFLEDKKMVHFSDFNKGDYFIFNKEKYNIYGIENFNYTGNLPICFDKLIITENGFLVHWPRYENLIFLRNQLLKEPEIQCEKPTQIKESQQPATNSYFHEPITIKQNKKTNVNRIKLL